MTTQILTRSGWTDVKDARTVARVSKHVSAVIDGVIHDSHDPSRDGTRCVYGYWTKEARDGLV